MCKHLVKNISKGFITNQKKAFNPGTDSQTNQNDMASSIAGKGVRKSMPEIEATDGEFKNLAASDGKLKSPLAEKNNDTESFMNEELSSRQLYKFKRSNSGHGKYATLGQLPNGKEINFYTRMDHIKLMDNTIQQLNSKSTISFSKRRKKQASVKFGYDSVFKTQDYHIIHGKGDQVGNLNILKNATIASSMDLPSNTNNALAFQKQSDRPSIVSRHNLLQDSRFVSINHHPSIFSKTTKPPSLKFSD